MAQRPWRPPGLSQLAALNIQLDINGNPLEETAGVWAPSIRIIASEYAGENVFDRLTNALPSTEQADAAETLREIADLTNSQVLAEMGRIELVAPQDRIYGQGTGLVMAAFAYPGAISRFSDGSAGTYYAARSIETAIAETRYHADQYLRGSGPCITEKTVLEADVDGTFLDVRRPRPAPPGVYDPSDYQAGQSLGALVRQLAGFGILYDSVRDKDGECVAVTRPPVLHNAVAVRTLQYVWDGTQVREVR
jgi:hypothetical protein